MPDDRNDAREPDAVDGRPIMYVAIALVAMIALAVGVAGWLTRAYANHDARPPALEPNALPATEGPPLEPDPAATLARFRAEKRALLAGYGWIDRAHGVTRIPIDEAMRIVAARAAAEGASPGGAEPRP